MARFILNGKPTTVAPAAVNAIGGFTGSTPRDLPWGHLPV